MTPHVLSGLKGRANELAAPLEAVAFLFPPGEGEAPVQGRELLLSDLMATALLFVGADGEAGERELALFDAVRRAVYGEGPAESEGRSLADMLRELLDRHPNKVVSADHPPQTLAVLRFFDSEHGTDYERKAKELFYGLAAAVVDSDGAATEVERIALENFRETLGL